MKLIGGGMIRNYNHIGTSLNGFILNLTPKGLNTFMFLQKVYISKNYRKDHFVGHSRLK